MSMDASEATRTLFGTDGIRGCANQDSMTPEVAFRLGAALTWELRQGKTQTPRIVVGKDTRLSGYMLETALASGVCALGGQVLLCGPLPTPAISYITTSMRADAGVVISASHNPYQDNGIKLFDRDGFKFPDSTETHLEAIMAGTAIDRNRPRGTGVGRAERIEDATGRYVTFAKSALPQHLSLVGTRICVDAAHGAAYRAAPSVFSELGATVYGLGDRPNGKNINHRVGALHPETCAREVIRRRADIGIALDGDADRLIVVDEKGNVVDGDTIMALCAGRMLQRKELKRRTLVSTVMSNLGLEQAIERQGGKMLRTAVGDRHVVAAMRKRQLNFGGEQSGHLVFLDHCTTGDGIVAALQLLSVVLEQQRPLSELASEAMERVPQVLLSETFRQRQKLSAMARTARATRAATKRLGNRGRVLVRWSGTEPKLRVMLEGPNSTTIQRMAEGIMDAAATDLSSLGNK